MSSKLLNWKLIIAGVILLALFIISFFYLKQIKAFFKIIITNNLTDWIVFAVITVIFLMHRVNNNGEKNTVSDKEGLNNFFDYIFFGARVLSLCYAVKILSILAFFPKEFGCTSLMVDVKLFVFITLGIIFYYLIEQLKPIASEAILAKAKIKLDKEDS